MVDIIFVKAFQQMQKPDEWLQEAMNPFVAWGKHIVALGKISTLVTFDHVNNSRTEDHI